MTPFYLSENEIITVAQQLRADSKRTGLILGCFDIIHPGHIYFLREAKKVCDILIVGLENDVNIKRAKGPSRPIHHLSQRAEVLSELKSIDYIFAVEREIEKYSNDDDQYYQNLVTAIHPHYFLTNRAKDKYWDKKKELAKRNSILLVDVPQKHRTSTSQITSIIEKEL